MLIHTAYYPDKNRLPTSCNNSVVATCVTLQIRSNKKTENRTTVRAKTAQTIHKGQRPAIEQKSQMSEYVIHRGKKTSSQPHTTQKTRQIRFTLKHKCALGSLSQMGPHNGRGFFYYLNSWLVGGATSGKLFTYHTS